MHHHWNPGTSFIFFASPHRTLAVPWIQLLSNYQTPLQISQLHRTVLDRCCWSEALIRHELLYLLRPQQAPQLGSNGTNCSILCTKFVFSDPLHLITPRSFLWRFMNKKLRKLRTFHAIWISMASSTAAWGPLAAIPFIPTKEESPKQTYHNIVRIWRSLKFWSFREPSAFSTVTCTDQDFNS